ncbi:MAG TPA: hypothetical protein VES40_18585 [Ilumatobacteraceae bacterium]|nr:hypothetical protein [Ilumatobacteraceae bacterium]
MSYSLGVGVCCRPFDDITAWSSPCEQVSSVVVYGTPTLGARIDPALDIQRW